MLVTLLSGALVGVGVFGGYAYIHWQEALQRERDLRQHCTELVMDKLALQLSQAKRQGDA